jgi:ATP-dependent Clp protease ATP-binding subunit ClpB
MQQQIDDQLANLLLAGQVTDGSLVRVDVRTDDAGLLVRPASLE